MRTSKIILMTLLLATLATGCKKDSDSRIRIFAERFDGSNSKVLINPGNIPAGAQWILDEPVNLNNYEYTVAEDAVGFYLQNNTGTDIADNTTMYALYPGGDFGGNTVEVTNTTTLREIVLKRLVVKLRADGTEEMAFPMYATAEGDATALNFRHLTAGLRLQLKRGSVGSPINVSKLKVVAQSTSAVQNLAYGGVEARWKVQGPTMPMGNVGENRDEVDIKYACEMNFDLKQGGNDYVAIPADASAVSFCIPLTINSVKNLVVIGYDANDVELFHVKKSFDDAVDVARNQMYTVPAIEVN